MLDEITFLSKEIEIHKNVNESKYFIEYNNNYFLISDFIYDILSYLKSNNKIEFKLISKKFNLNNSDAIFIFEEIKRILITIKTSENKGNIKFKLTIINTKYVNKISKIFTHLIPRNIKSFILALLIISTLFFLFFYLLRDNFETHSEINYLILYPIFIIILLFHEFGHAVAAKKFGLTPKEIGFGIFFIIPILYSNVSCIWILDKHKRVIVNLSGIYFQLLVSLFFSIFLFEHTELLMILYSMNIGLLFFSLFPFIKTDGYWVISDYFDKLNLFERANNYLFMLYKKKEKFNLFYFSYSISHFIFIFFVIYTYYKNFHISELNIQNLTYKVIFKYTFYLIMMYFLIISLASKFKKKTFKNIQL